MSEEEPELRYEDLPAEMDEISTSRYYDKLGQPIGMRRWCVLFGDMEYRRIAEDTVGEYWISTVWTGLDHNHSRFYGGPTEPLIFETMVFPSSEIMARASTEEEALRQHNEAVALMRTQVELFDGND